MANAPEPSGSRLTPPEPGCRQSVLRCYRNCCVRTRAVRPHCYDSYPLMVSSGTHLGPYEIVALLGAGGMGEVYRARDSRLNRTVAVKILPPQVAADPGRRARFEQEARAASALNHPNILSVYDIGEQDGLAYIVSELIEGESLRDSLRRGP